jgi:alpha-glucuronidase
MRAVTVDWKRAWLSFRAPTDATVRAAWSRLASDHRVSGTSEYANAARAALADGFSCVLPTPVTQTAFPHDSLLLQVDEALSASDAIRVRLGDDGRTLLLEVSDERLLPFVAYWLLRYLQRGELPPAPGTHDETFVQLRAISQWDNLDRTIERGYAGLSFFDWNDAERFADRQEAYARLLCAAGINTVFLNNVNAAPEVLTDARIESLKVFADRLRPWGIRVGIAVNFGSPVALGELETADPCEPAVREWWSERAGRLYNAVPDLIGLLVKANSEGQPGPQDYGRDHTDGANMLAAAVAPYGGTVFWRAFVYRWNPSGRVTGDGHDSLHDSYDTFVPLDGLFADNVVVVIKNGPIDFQVREPIHPLLPAMTRTRCLLEFQVTQEYTGQDVHLCFLPSQWAHYLDEPLDQTNRLADMVRGGNAPAARDAGATYAGLLGVSAWGDSDCWSGHPLAQANLYGFGRLSWNPGETPQRIASDWTTQTLGSSLRVGRATTEMLLHSWRTYESYTSPLGLGMMHCKARHLDPAPKERAYAHRADSTGIGRDRTGASGSGFSTLYPEPLRSRYEDCDRTDEHLLLMFHRVGWDYRLSSGLSVAEALEANYRSGILGVADMMRLWDSLCDEIDPRTHDDIAARLSGQLEHAQKWAESMLGYFLRRREQHGQ